MQPDVITTLIELKEALDRTGIDYMVVGSLASSAHGLPRATRGDELDLAYMRRWAANLGIDDLLQRTLETYWPQADRSQGDL